jgi:hypothetical protein
VTPIAMSAAIAERWRHGGRSTLATVGVSVDGPVEIDLKRYGPHGLIAGAAGLDGRGRGVAGGGNAPAGDRDR